MISLMKYIKECGYLQTEAAKRLNTSPARISNLMNHRIDLFSTEMLLDMMERAGFKVYETLKLDINKFLSHGWRKIQSQ